MADKYCSNCGAKLLSNDNYCPKCGKQQNNGVPSPLQQNSTNSEKSRGIAALLCFFIGGFGVHRFYVGKSGTGILQIILTCCFGAGCIWAFIDFILIVCGSFKDSNGKYLLDWNF